MSRELLEVMRAASGIAVQEWPGMEPQMMILHDRNGTFDGMTIRKLLKIDDDMNKAVKDGLNEAGLKVIDGESNMLGLGPSMTMEAIFSSNPAPPWRTCDCSFVVLLGRIWSAAKWISSRWCIRRCSMITWATK